jgi:hypothetical protein
MLSYNYLSSTIISYAGMERTWNPGQKPGIYHFLVKKLWNPGMSTKISWNDYNLLV